MANELGYSNRVEYAFIHNILGYKEINEPRNWRDDGKEYNRNSKNYYGGIFGKMSEDVEFTGVGRDFILQVYSAYGSNTDLRLIKNAKDPVTDEWYRVWDGEIDLTTLKQEGMICTAKFNADGLETIIKSRENEKYEIEREEDLFGNTMPPIDIDLMELRGRKILLESLLKVAENTRDDNQFHMSDRTNSNRYGSMSLPVSIDYQSDEHVTTPSNGEIHWGKNDGTTGLMFYLTNDRDKILNISINLSFTIREIDVNRVGHPFFQVQFVKYENGANFDVLSRDILYDEPTPRNMNGRKVDYSGTYNNYELLTGESLALIIYAGGSDFGDIDENGDIFVALDDCETSISISEDSFIEPSQANVLLPYECIDRLMTIITGRDDAFYSEVLGRTDLGYAQDGEAALCGLSHGHWKRRFVKGDDLYIPFATSIKDFMQSFGSVWGLAMGIEKVGYQERLRIEKREYFYNRNVTIRLGEYDSNGKFIYQQVNQLVRTVNSEALYSEIKVGTDKFEKYEEIQGLDEYNTQSAYSTPIYKNPKPLSLLSKYRRDATGGEIARRKQKEISPTEDTKYDDKIFMEHLKRSVTNVFQQRNWQDDLEYAPKGIFDPDSATNLMLSQVRMLFRNGYDITPPLTKYQNDYVRFTSSEGNANLETKVSGENPYTEKQDILSSDFGRAISEPEMVEFEFKVNDKLLHLLDQKTIIFGEEVPNKYGLIEFKNEKGEIEKGHIEAIKPNGKGEWKIKKYYELNN